MPNKPQRRLPKTVVADLIETSEWLSKLSGQPAKKIFQHYLTLMDKYETYFFSEPWPQKYSFKQATTFSELDLNFLSGNEKETVDKSDKAERLEVVLLRKNICVENSQILFGMLWTYDALEEALGDDLPL